MTQCQCGSGHSYAKCCEPLHLGVEAPANALALMRSRYVAYARHLADYIIDTTHPENPLFQQDRDKWRREILHFSHETSLQGLKIVAFENIDATTAKVTFRAFLRQHGREVSFTEESLFTCVAGRWLYLKGSILPESSSSK